jgi:hypothetical protein
MTRAQRAGGKGLTRQSTRARVTSRVPGYERAIQKEIILNVA